MSKREAPEYVANSAKNIITQKRRQSYPCYNISPLCIIQVFHVYKIEAISFGTRKYNAVILMIIIVTIRFLSTNAINLFQAQTMCKRVCT